MVGSMKLTRTLRLLIILVTGAAVQLPVEAVDWRFPVAISYSTGFVDVKDAALDYYRAQGWAVDEDVFVPVSVMFMPYVEFDSGIGVGASVGPPMFVAVEETVGTDESTDLSYIVPIGAHVRYTFLRDGNISPYARLGISYPIAGGNMIDGSTPGVLAGVGAEFLRTKKVGFGIEAAYDSSEVKMIGGERIKASEFLFSLYVVF